MTSKNSEEFNNQRGGGEKITNEISEGNGDGGTGVNDQDGTNKQDIKKTSNTLGSGSQINNQAQKKADQNEEVKNLKGSTPTGEAIVDEKKQVGPTPITAVTTNNQKISAPFDINEDLVIMDDTQKEDKNFYHEGLLDVRENKGISGVDFKSEDLNNIDPDNMQSFMDQGVNLNKRFIDIYSNLKTLYPYANIKPGKDVPIAVVTKQVKDNMTPLFGKYTSENSIKTFMQERTNELKDGKNATYHTNLTAQLTKRKSAIQEVARDIREDERTLLRLSLMYATNKRSLKEYRDNASELFYLPTTVTAKAISMLITSHVLTMSTTEQAIRYGVPTRGMIKNLATELGYKDIGDLENDIENGSMMKAMRVMKKINLNDNKEVKIPHEFDGLNETIDNLKVKCKKEAITKAAAAEKNLERKAQLDAQKADFDLIDCDGEIENNSVFNEENTELTKADRLDLAKIICGSETNLKVMPFVYSNIYSYKVLYYFYLNQHGSTLPFGKTIPNSTWLIIFSYMIDSQNALRLRFNLAEYCLKLGGVGLVEKSEFYTMASSRKLRNFFKPTINSGSDVTNFKFAATACLTAIAKLQSKRIKMAELCDLRAALKQKLSIAMKQTTHIIDINNLIDDLQYKEKIGKLQTLVKDGLEDTTHNDSFISSMLSDYGVSYKPNRTRMSDLNELLSFGAFKMASEMIVNYQLYKSEKLEGKAWFVFALFKHGDDGAGYFSVIYGMYSEEDLAGTLAVLFGSSKMAENVHHYIKKAEALIANMESEEYQEVTSSSIFQTKTLVKAWSTIEADAIIRDNPNTADIVKRGLNQQDRSANRNPIDEDSQTIVLNKKTAMITENITNTDISHNLKKRGPDQSSTIDHKKAIVKLNEIEKITLSSWHTMVRDINRVDLKFIYSDFISTLDIFVKEKYLKQLLVLSAKFLSEEMGPEFDSSLISKINETPADMKDDLILLAKNLIDTAKIIQSDFGNSVQKLLFVLIDNL